jgi:hypothetical protein
MPVSFAVMTFRVGFEMSLHARLHHNKCSGCASILRCVFVCLQVNVEEVKREHKKAADAVVEAVHSALSEGLQHTKAGAGGSKPISGAAAKAAATGTAAAAKGEAVSPGSKRKAADSATAGDHPAPAGVAVAAKKRKTMLDMVEGAGSDEDSASEDESFGGEA